MASRIDILQIYKEIQRGKRHSFPMRIWEKITPSDCIPVIKYMLEKQLKWSRIDMHEYLSKRTFLRFGLGQMLDAHFGGDVYETLNVAYPGEFKWWELKYAKPRAWDIDEGIKATKWLIEEKLKWSRREVCSHLHKKSFSHHGLGDMLNICFDNSIFLALAVSYPGKYKPWEVTHSSRIEWSHEYGIEAVKWLVEEKLGLDPSSKQVRTRVTRRNFSLNGLDRMLSILFSGKVNIALSTAYPNQVLEKTQLEPNEKKTKRGHRATSKWTESTGAEAIRDLIENKLGWSREDVCANMDWSTFGKYGLGGLVCNLYNNSPFQALDAAYPNEYKPWELKHAPQRYWTTETGIQATKWLIEEKLKWSREEICKQLTQNTFRKNDLGSMLAYSFGNSVYKALNAVYPSQFKPWELKKVPQGFWNSETGIEATKWLFEEKLKWTVYQTINTATRSVFKQNGLAGMLEVCYKTRVKDAVYAAYPQN